MKLFTVGPVEMYPQTLKVAGSQVPYFRNDDFSQVMFECDAAFQRLAGCGEGSRTIVLTASGTGAMEAVVENCMAQGGRALVIDGGSFGRRFVQLCEVHGVDHDVCEVPLDSALTPALLEPFAGRGRYTDLLVNLDETSVGKLYDIDLLARFCRDNDIFLTVDAISAFLADPISCAGSGIDALIVSSQKALSLEPGISVVALSGRMIAERVMCAPVTSMYFDFKSYLKNGERGQTPFTPAVGIVYQLQEMLSRVEVGGGADAWIAATRKVALDFRSRLAGLPVHIPTYPLSNALTPVVFDKADAREVNRRLVDEYGLVINPCGGDNASRMVRVAHIGNHPIADNEELVNALSVILGIS